MVSNNRRQFRTETIPDLQETCQNFPEVRNNDLQHTPVMTSGSKG